MTTRDPFPLEKFDNDDKFGNKTTTKETLNFTPSPDRFLRLSRSHTLSSIRREHAYFDPQVPNDSLDFTIKARYNPWQFNAPKNVTKVQAETVCDDHGRILKNRVKVIPPPFDPADPPLFVRSAVKKENPFSKEGKQAIEGYYHPSTNPGYSRKPNGNFYKV